MLSGLKNVETELNLFVDKEKTIEVVNKIVCQFDKALGEWI